MSVTLCMIAKNGAASLPRALESARPFVDEIVFVDTGSTDDSAEIAATFDARVFRIPWASDFSKARNYALSHARGSWILVLDTDEFLETSHAAMEAATKDGVAKILIIRNYVSEDDALCGGLDFHQVDSNGELYFENSLVRLFPRSLGIGFRGAVHESVEESLLECNIPKEVASDVRIVHARSQSPLREKVQRYAELAQRALQRSAGDWLSRRTLGLWHAMIGNDQSAIELLARCDDEKPGDSATLYALCSCLSKQGDLVTAVRILAKLVSEDPSLPSSLLLARLQNEKGQHAVALANIERTCLSHPRSVGVWIERAKIEMGYDLNHRAVMSLQVATGLVYRYPKLHQRLQAPLELLLFLDQRLADIRL